MNKKRVCSFCGRDESEVGLLISGIHGFICDDCAEQAHEIVSMNMKGDTRPLKDRPIPKPKEIKDFLDQYVITAFCLWALREPVKRSWQRL